MLAQGAGSGSPEGGRLNTRRSCGREGGGAGENQASKRLSIPHPRRPSAVLRAQSLRARTGHADGATLGAMNTRRTFVALAAAAGLASCGPTTVNITTTTHGSAEDSDSGSTTGTETTLGLGASESSIGLDTSDSGHDSTTTGDVGGGSSSGEPPPICVDPLTGACSCPIASGPLGCFCGDIEVAPAYCEPPCLLAGPAECTCTPEYTPAGCYCGDVLMPCPCAFEGGECVCNDTPSDSSQCGCVAIGAQCICAGLVTIPEYCE